MVDGTDLHQHAREQSLSMAMMGTAGVSLRKFRCPDGPLKVPAVFVKDHVEPMWPGCPGRRHFTPPFFAFLFLLFRMPLTACCSRDDSVLHCPNAFS